MFTDSSSSVSSTLPVCIVLNSANPAQCADPPPLLPCIERIELEDITCSSTWLRSLFSTLLTLEQNAVCILTEVSCQGTFIDSAELSCFKKTLAYYNGYTSSPECDVLWEVLHGLNIKSLSLDTSIINCAGSMPQSLLSLTHLDTLSIKVDDDSPGLWEALHGLNIKSLSLSGRYGYLNVHNADSMSQSLLSLTHLDTLSIKANNYSLGLLEALHGLNIKSLSLSGGHGGLYTLSIKVDDDSPGLWKALHGLNIKSLSLCGHYGYLNVHNADSMSQSLSSLTHLDTLSIEVFRYYPGLWKALHGLNIKSLILSGQYGYLNVKHAETIAQSLSSLKQLEKLSIFLRTYIDIKLPQSLKYLNIYCVTLLPSELHELVGTLSACTRTVECKLEFGCASFNDARVKSIPPEEYISIQQELGTLNHVAVKRFQILHRRRKTNICEYNAASPWSVRAICGVQDDNTDDDNVNDVA
ncbi:hypothetical protein DPMN_152927 [Dreissena polymorpha]|uniref:Uncharacterized protein n=1 Tax=Dreissena polymorpha TaxID=45954 RepID=A0A9D4FMT7_DREPO|nr:hypothetical protein DPMN_152927 [Dreissena polymorpha]